MKSHLMLIPSLSQDFEETWWNHQRKVNKENDNSVYLILEFYHYSLLE